MIEALVVIIPLIAFASGAVFGYRRTGARQWGWLSAGVSGTLAAAGACYLISQTKTGGYLAGIVGAVMAMVALITAGGILAGAMARGIHELSAPETPRLNGLGVADAGVVGLLALAMVAISAME